MQPIGCQLATAKLAAEMHRCLLRFQDFGDVEGSSPNHLREYVELLLLAHFSVDETWSVTSWRYLLVAVLFARTESS